MTYFRVNKTTDTAILPRWVLTPVPGTHSWLQSCMSSLAPSADLQEARGIKALAKGWSTFAKVCSALLLLPLWSAPGNDLPAAPGPWQLLPHSKTWRRKISSSQGETHSYWERCNLCIAMERNGSLNPGQSQNSCPRQGALSSCVQTPNGRQSSCCLDDLIFILFHVCSAEITAVKCFH